MLVQIFAFMSQLLQSPGTLLMWINLRKTHEIKLQVQCSLAMKVWATSRHLHRRMHDEFPDRGIALHIYTKLCEYICRRWIEHENK